MNDFENLELVEFFLRGVLLLALAWFFAWWLSPGKAQNRFWRVQFLLLGVMALVGFFPGLRWMNVADEEVPPAMQLAPVNAEIVLPAAEFAPVNHPSYPSQPTTVETVGSDWNFTSILLGLWLAGAGLLSVKLVFSRVQLALLLRNARAVVIDETKVFVSDQVTAPLSFGGVKSGIVVPADFAQWSADEREMALRHERCHLTRRDGLWHGLASLMVVLHWPNPLVWFARKRLERDCELAVDREVVSSGISPTGYSELLVRLASVSGKSPTMAMAKKSSVPLRVEKILNHNTRGAVSKTPLVWLAMGFLAGIAITLGVTSLGHKPASDTVKKDGGDGFHLHTYVVPPNFLPDDDPYRPQPHTPKSWLTESGVPFPEGSSAVYLPAESKLMVQNTLINLSIVEAVLKERRREIELSSWRLVVTPTIVDYPRQGFEKVSGTEWLPKPENPNGSITAVLTDPQFQVVRRAFDQKEDVRISNFPSIYVKSGETGKIENSNPTKEREWIGDFTLEITPTFGADNLVLELTVHQWLDEAGNPARVIVWDNHTLAWVEQGDGDRVRLTFLSAKIVDPAGLPINEPVDPFAPLSVDPFAPAPN